MSQVELDRQGGSVTGLIWQNSVLQNKTETHSRKFNTLAKCRGFWDVMCIMQDN